MKTALIDGDIVAYSVGFAAEHEPLENALHSVKIMIRSMLDRVKADSYRVFLTGDKNYRVDLATIKPYKGNRKAAKPEHHEEIRKYLIDIHNAEVINGREADDAMGVAQSTAEPDTTIICSIDKDMDMIAGWHYNWRRDEKYYVEPHEADLFFMKQLVTGDATDNIAGVPNKGPKAFDNALEYCENMTDLYWEILCMYEEAYDKPFEAMMENANLLWIQRRDNELWNPLSAELAYAVEET